MSERSRLQPTPRALALFAAGLVLAAAPALGAPGLWPLWLAFCALALLALGIDALLCPPPRVLLVEVEAPALVFVGRPGLGALHLRLAGRRPRPAEATLDLAAIFEPIVLEPFSLGSKPTSVPLSFVARRRGRGQLERLWVRYAGPLGLVRRIVERPLDRSVGAVPDIAFTRTDALRNLELHDPWIGQKIERHTGDGTEFEALREFMPGLDPRSIDWKATARHRRLLAREFRVERNHQLVLAIDHGRLMAEPVAGVPILDHAIHAALLLAHVSLRHGDRVNLFSFADRPGGLLAPSGGLRSLGSLYEWVSRLEYRQEESNYTLALTDLLGRLHRRSLVVTMTDFVDTITAELMVENLLRLARRHLVIFVAFRDPLLEELTAKEPRSMLEVRRAVAAEGLLRERELVLARLRRAGVFAIDAVPAQIGPRLIDRYLDVKRRELV